MKASLRALLRPARDVYKRLTLRQGSRQAVQDYWRTPPDAGNRPEKYLEGAARSAWLVDLVRPYAPADAKVLEIGCNVGRNLHHLFNAGYRNLTGIEISENAVRLMRQTFPELVATIHTGAVEEHIKQFPDGEFGLVFTMAVLEHIHHESDWVFAEIVRVTRSLLVTVEDEREFSERHFPRNYRRVFTALGIQHVCSLGCDRIEGLGPGFYARVFKKAS